MTFVPTTPPGAISGNTPIVFTLTREPWNVSVRMFPVDDDGNAITGAWDVVYGGTDNTGANGSFADRYPDSSRSGNTWTVRPPGGTWPCPVRIWVDEAPVPTTPTGWDVLLDFDFTAEPDGTLHPLNMPGDYTETIGGLTWQCHYGGNINPGFPAPGQLNGLGYRLTDSGHTANGNNGNGSCIGIDYQSLSEFVSGRAICVLAVVNGLTNINANTRAIVGTYKPRSASQAQSPIEMGSGIMGGYTPRTASSDIAPILSADGALDVPTPGTQLATLSATTTASVFGAIRYSGTYGEAVFGAYSGTLPVVEKLKSAGGVDVPYAGGTTGLVAGVMNGGDGNGNNPAACYVQRLLVLQAKS